MIKNKSKLTFPYIQILEFIKCYQDQNDIPPSTKIMMDKLHLSTGGVGSRILRLKRMGVISRVDKSYDSKYIFNDQS